MQIRKRVYGPSVWPSLALCDGRGFLLRGDATGEIYLVYVLRWQVGRAAIQVLIQKALVKDQSQSVTIGGWNKLIWDRL